MSDWRSTFLYGPRVCPDCGMPNVRSASHCAGCGERIRGHNPLIRVLVTIVALAAAGGYLYFKVFR